MITAAILSAVMPQAGAANIALYIDPLADACAEFDIGTPLRLASFLAQVAHESGQLSRVSENLNYSVAGLVATFPKYFTAATAPAYARQPEKIANKVYAGRMGNGDEASGDGWRFRGRGLIQVTGRTNYGACAAALGLDLLTEPALLAAPVPACRSAAWFWKERGLNGLAEARDFVTITRRINGGIHGLAERQAYYDRACAVLNV